MASSLAQFEAIFGSPPNSGPCCLYSQLVTSFANSSREEKKCKITLPDGREVFVTLSKKCPQKENLDFKVLEHFHRNAFTTHDALSETLSLRDAFVKKHEKLPSHIHDIFIDMIRAIRNPHHEVESSDEEDKPAAKADVSNKRRSKRIAEKADASKRQKKE